ncbi:MAG: alpha/beta fold hydrolase [Promethearchaeota archaeon]
MEIEEEHTINTQKCPIHYWLSGQEDKPFLIFSHGALMDHRMFNLQIEEVKKYFRVLAWDIRGHGKSQPMGKKFSIKLVVEDLMGILDTLGYEKAIFVGHSLGGIISQEIVFAYPERVRALVSIGAPCTTLKISKAEKIKLFLLKLFMPLSPYKLLLKLIPITLTINKEFHPYFIEVTNIISKETFIEIWKEILISNHYEPDYRITHPLLLTHGDKDLRIVVSHAKKWSERDPNCKYVIIPNARHNSNQDNASFFNKLLLNFLFKL